ncbi:hypothetical protein Z046_29340 [Pseudomonas aeruginosa VRFPA09]|nr:hypothetical protein Z046_29340 [Pseudomonas aeruginosa VRFPA09]
MATPAYMSITGTKQGLITAGAFTEDSVGNTYQEGHEDQVMVQGFNHEVIIPRDPQSGQPTGQRVHKPVVITKVFDKASPLLLAALTSGERLTKVEIQWYRTSAAGTQEHYYTTVLEDAIIVDIKDYMHLRGQSCRTTTGGTCGAGGSLYANLYGASSVVALG